MRPETCDIAILGGGLAGGLIALALAAHRPELDVLVIERGEKLGGDHVWSFFASDIPSAGAKLIEPMIAARWDGYSVRFPNVCRSLKTPYRSVTSERLDAAVREAMGGDRVLTGTSVIDATQDSVTLQGDHVIRAKGVVDARGIGAMPHMRGGWQTFAGQMLRLATPHGLTQPVVMDACVEQVDGYRFVYCLPFSPTEVFVEDTYYADTPEIDLPMLRRRIADYAAQHDWQVAQVSYEETGALPVIAGGNFDAFWPARADTPARAGVRAALVHPLTSYSLPDAVRFALHLTALDNISGASLERASHAWAAEHWRQGRFYRMLSSMLFGAAAPDARWRMLERFYALPEPLIERFYAGRSSWTDMLRILAGKPPVPVLAALASLIGRGRPLADLGRQRGNRA